ncbi:MAG: Asp-tRNA(Asn)/Glu-tRNA(Gln) amidotransferase GatCAB subunit B, partial [Candidatus Dadabacteria bacterium]
TKEESSDYRYFPDPDIPPLYIEDAWIEKIRASMPVLPGEAYKKLTEVYGLSDYDANVLIAERKYFDYFEAAFAECSNARSVCNWITSELFGHLNKKSVSFDESKVSPASLGQLVKLIDSDVISGKMAKAVFEEMFETGDPPEEIVERRGMRQVTDREQIRQVVLKALQENEKQLNDYLHGNEKLFGFFIGQAMKLSGGSLSPRITNEVLREELDKLKG